LIFFKELAKEHQESAWLRRLKKLLSLLLTLAALLLVVFALSRLVFAPELGDLKGVVVLLDRSASMAAEEDGESRLEAAKALLRQRLDAVPEVLAVALIAYDSRPEVLVPLTTNRRELMRSLAEVSVRPLGDDPKPAIDLAKRIASLEGPAEVWWASDQVPNMDKIDTSNGEVIATEPENISIAEKQESDGDAETTGAAIVVREFPLGLEKPTNFGITGFQIRPVPLEPGKFEAFIEVAASEGLEKATEIALDVQVGGVLAGVPRLDIEPGGQAGFYQSLDGARGQLLEVSIRAEGDVLDLDNQVIARLPESRPLVVHRFAEVADPFTDLALQSIAEEGQIEIWKGGPSNWPPQIEGDVIIFDGWLPAEWPSDTPAIVINPPGDEAGPVPAVRLKSPIPRDSIRVADADHPVLFRVTSGRIAVTQTCVIDGSRSLQPLWFSGSEPLLAAGELGGQRLVLMGFAASASEQLPLLASYPLLLGNAIFWSAEDAEAERNTPTLPTGSFVDSRGGQLAWEELGKNGLIPADSVPAGAAIELDRLGLWSREDGTQGGSLLLSRHETSLTGKSSVESENAGSDRTEGSGKSTLLRRLTGEVTPWFLGLVLVILLLESFLFHRKSLY